MPGNLRHVRKRFPPALSVAPWPRAIPRGRSWWRKPGGAVRFDNRILPTLRDVPHVAEDEPAVCAWYPTARKALAWNLGEQFRTLTLVLGSRRRALQLVRSRQRSRIFRKPARAERAVSGAAPGVTARRNRGKLEVRTEVVGTLPSLELPGWPVAH